MSVHHFCCVLNVIVQSHMITFRDNVFTTTLHSPKQVRRVMAVCVKMSDTLCTIKILQYTPLQKIWIYVSIYGRWFAKYYRISNVNAKRFLELLEAFLYLTILEISVMWRKVELSGRFVAIHLIRLNTKVWQTCYVIN